MRCGRALSDPRSVARRYGPTCWKRVRIENERDYQDWLTEHSSIEDSNVAAKILKEVWAKVLSLVGDQTCYCGELLSSGDLLSFDHRDGAPLRGYSAPQWVFLRCSRCQNEVNLIRLGINLAAFAPPNPECDNVVAAVSCDYQKTIEVDDDR